ncbi:MAG: transketolase C-terminal domain-containing protein [bacterium]
MSKRVGMEVSIAVAEAVRLANVDVVAAYPITPQTHIVEHLSELVADGDLDAEFVCVESEHSAMSACLGSSAAGARSFTATASQGLALMHEILFIAPAMRLPIVMTVANRALSGPLSIWNDHSDVMASRDCGWIQYFVENGQEAFDHVLIAFRAAEDPAVLLPAIVNLDGFILSHMIEPHVLMEQEEADRFLPPFQPRYRLDPDKPLTMGDFAMPDIYTEIKNAQEVALRDSRAVIDRVWQQFGDLTGRRYKAVETYKAEGAEVLLLTMGSVGETASVAVDRMREAGLPVGLVKLRLWRPFPAEDLRRILGPVRKLVVVDRAISFGAGTNPVAAEITTQLYDLDPRPRVFNAVVGLGGRDVRAKDLEEILERALKADGRPAPVGAYDLIGVRE